MRQCCILHQFIWLVSSLCVAWVLHFPPALFGTLAILDIQVMQNGICEFQASSVSRNLSLYLLSGLLLKEVVISICESILSGSSALSKASSVTALSCEGINTLPSRLSEAPL
ncbi:hypothetical protein RRG08_041190 [Elysia crispata]|uniref:Uncharacterized protein n=1 Tax=Elysia crispata TaxID=231223 RepID=A0AAE1CPN3_9GAST|nr:hypothetical protein RRG08_041190 [Elysia crispata]